MKIWVLGSKHQCDKSILWTEEFDHFSNCDFLIINLTSLTEQILKGNKEKFYEQGRKYLFDLLMAREKKVIIVMNENQIISEWLPFSPVIKTSSPVNIKNAEIEGFLNDYMKNVEKCNYYIHEFNIQYIDDKTNPKSKLHENLEFTPQILETNDWYLYYVRVNEALVKNQAEQIVGGSFSWRILLDYKVFVHGRGTKNLHTTNAIFVLPPTTKVAVKHGIDLIINTLYDRKLKESPPEWEKTIDLPNLSKLQGGISLKKQEKVKITQELESLEKELNELTTFRRLLWTKGLPLEEIVKEAFVFLGFPEIRKIRASNREDWLFEFQTLSDFEYGVFEVKGADQRTSLADLTQCNKWVEDYIRKKLGKAKGIFVPNQHRLQNPSDPQDREHFEPNEIDYATTREICILPAHEIFNAVIEKMKNNPDINREKIEKILASSNGLCKLVET